MSGESAVLSDKAYFLTTFYRIVANSKIIIIIIITIILIKVILF